ncbi:hypothetical protein CKAH01_01585 [Colletotrichum kahawae]|uniref:Uncharacterized protein n=1 Tax=Colletotrichum kahawae TaxID=34407 RepID=A0AAD9Y8H6_COLKA|nr:hypothetical protein CKAH01_01585 [Colletotrichum kahawae]
MAQVRQGQQGKAGNTTSEHQHGDEGHRQCLWCGFGCLRGCVAALEGKKDIHSISHYQGPAAGGLQTWPWIGAIASPTNAAGDSGHLKPKIHSHPTASVRQPLTAFPVCSTPSSSSQCSSSDW